MILSVMFESYIEYLSLYNSAGYVSFTRRLHQLTLRTIGNVDSSVLTKQYIQKLMMMEKVELKFSATTINKHISYLKRLYKFNEIECPFKDVKKIKENFVTFGTCQVNPNDMIDEAIKPLTLKNKAIVLIFYDTGIRLNELLHLKKENVDLEKRTIYLQFTKTNRPRFVFFTNNTKKILIHYLDTCNENQELLFVDKNGEMIKPNAIECLFKRIRQRLNIKKFSPHRLRHSLSTELYSNGCNLILISSILGHLDVNTTKRYIHPDLDKERITYDKMHCKTPR